jgi:opacity protein-like surface antigen
MQIGRRVVATSFAIWIASTALASAADSVPYNWTGCYVGGNVGVGLLNSTSTVNTSQATIAPVTVPVTVGPTAVQGNVGALTVPVNVAGINTTVKTGAFAVPISLGAFTLPISAGPFNLGAFQAQGAGSNTGAVVGAQVGCNLMQIPNATFGSLVYGVEGDFEIAAPPKQVGQAITAAGVLNFGLPVSGLIKGRIGFTPLERVMFYVTAGGGVAETAVLLTTLSTSALALTTTQILKPQAVWAVGFGVEAALSRHWTVKAEYLYLDAGTVTDTFAFLGAPATAKVMMQNNLFRAGLNYRF